MSDAARRARRRRPFGSPPTLALAGEVDPAPLRVAGWRLRGRLFGDPFGERPELETYADVEEMLDDSALDAVAVDGEDPGLAARIPELRGAGLLLLLPTAAPLEPDLVVAAHSVPDAAQAYVGLVRRWEPWALTVAAALPLAGGAPVQVTVRGWPHGRQAAAELVDLVRIWCGDVVAAVAAPAPLPAPHLPAMGAEDPAPVAWSLLTSCGATVLVSHRGAQRVRLSFPDARLDAGPTGVRWEGGAVLPLLPLPAQVPRPGRCEPGLVATAAALARAVGGQDGAVQDGSAPADLGDLLVVARVLAALRTSARTDLLVPLP